MLHPPPPDHDQNAARPLGRRSQIRAIDMTEAYQLLSALYDSGEWGAISLGYLDHIKELKRRFDFHPTSVIDVSCGTGTLIGELAKSYRAVGSDISSPMKEKARSKFPSIPFHVSGMS